MIFTKEDLINPAHHSGVEVEAVEIWAENCLPDVGCLVYSWDECDESIHTLCCYNGGDEDWVVITQKAFKYIPHWLEEMDSMSDPDVYILNNCVIYVGR